MFFIGANKEKGNKYTSVGEVFTNLDELIN